MRAFVVTKCGECKYENLEGFGDGSCDQVDAEYGESTYSNNRDGITPSCPMWNESIEVSE